MKPNNEILKELQELGSTLAQTDRIVPFAVPEGYFEASLSNSLLLISEDKKPEFGFIPNPLQAPDESYFDNLAQVVLEKVRMEKVLEPAKEEMPFTVPEGYFDGLAAKVLAKAEKSSEAKETKVVTFRPFTMRRSVQLAAAILAFLMVGFGTLQYIKPGEAENITAEQKLASLSKEEISRYVQNNIDDFDSETIALAMGNETQTGTDGEWDFTKDEILDYWYDDEPTDPENNI